jgi:hypothetical protein
VIVLAIYLSNRKLYREIYLCKRGVGVEALHLASTKLKQAAPSLAAGSS